MVGGGGGGAWCHFGGASAGGAGWRCAVQRADLPPADLSWYLLWDLSWDLSWFDFSGDGKLKLLCAGGTCRTNQDPILWVLKC